MLRHYALKKNLLDVPNARSSHVIPTPRGGGVAIVITFLVPLLLLGWFDAIPMTPLLAMSGAGAMVALIGFLDDHRHIAVRWRLLAHCVAAVWALAWLGWMPAITIFSYSLEPDWTVQLLATLYLVWMLNLYNFMDGIDGIASMEAITACIGAIIVYFLSRDITFSAVLPELTLMASIAGFMIWNFPRAKIFMGDAGSGFIGIMLGIFSIHAAWQAPQLFWAWLILLGVFIVDATVTLIRRLLRGERLHEAHRSHAYQYAARHFNSHVPVTLAVAAINLGWLLPMAVLVALNHVDGVIGVVIAYLPLVWLAVHFQAGKREQRV